MLRYRVKFRKQFYTKEGTLELSSAKMHFRDFGATRMTVKELERGVIRAEKKANRTPFQTKKDMYVAQAEAYRKRLAYYFS